MTQADTYTGPETRVSITSTNASAVHAKAVELGKNVLRMTTAAGSGHPSSALALSHIIVELMYRQMRYDPTDPWNPGNDRLILSIGHAVPIVYAAYADLGGTVGWDRAGGHTLSVDELLTLRELGSVLEGHPNPAEGFPFFDAATGSLGQGLSVGAGLALAARLDHIDKRFYVVMGDGESREGQVWEAADFIVDHRLDNVCAIFSCNCYGQAARVSPQQSADVIAAKAAAFGWHVVVVDGHNPGELSAAFAAMGTTGKPLAVVARTVKGWGVSSMMGKNFHGKPMPADELDALLAELDATREELGAGPDHSLTPDSPVAAPPPKKTKRITLPPLDKALSRIGLASALETRELATRTAYGVALVALGDADERIVSLDADVNNSTYAVLFAAEHADRFFECKIAEQNMVSAGVGLAAAGKIPFASSFAKFLARGTDQIDMAAISRANLKLVGSHSGISLGADGPSQMSVSDVAYFRSLTRVDPGSGRSPCCVFQPCDAISAYRCCELMANIEGLCYLRTHRPAAPFVYSLDEQFELGGCKHLRRGDRLTLVSCGFILHTVVKAAEELSAKGVECNVFDAYTLPLDPSPIFSVAGGSGGIILTVEDNYLGGLHAELAEYAAQSKNVRVFGMTATRFPKSARTASEVFSHVGVAFEHIVERAIELVGRSAR